MSMTKIHQNPPLRQPVNLFKVQDSRFNVDELKRVINFTPILHNSITPK
jgi:hypothetical protein